MDEEYEVLLVTEGGCGSKSIKETWAILNEHGIAPTPYETLVDARWFEEMNFCGCGCPEETQEWLAAVLDAIKARSDSRYTRDDVQAAIGLNENAAYFVLYALDAMGLTDHGGSVGGCWLTTEGERLLADLTGIPS